MLEFTQDQQWSTDRYDGIYYVPARLSLKDKNKLVVETNVHSCREFFVRAYRNKISQSGSTGMLLECRKAQVLYTSGQTYKNMRESKQSALRVNAEKALFIINSFEKAHKWPLTKVYEAHCVNKDLPAMFWSGPRKWTTSPYYMSIWTLLIRIGKCPWLPSNLLTLSHEDLVRQLAIACKCSSNGDANQMSKTIREWDPFMSLYKDLFGNNTRKYHWDTSHLHGRADRPEGILKLMTGTTGYKELHNRYFALKKEMKLT